MRQTRMLIFLAGMAITGVCCWIVPQTMALEHAPSWPNNTTCRYGLPGEGSGNQYVDEMAVGGYAMCRFGNYLTRDDGILAREVLAFNYLTTGPFSTAGMDNPHGGGLFVWGNESSSSERRFTFAELNADNWVIPPSGGLGGVVIDAGLWRRHLYRHFSMSDSQLPGIDANTKKYVILIHGWNPDSLADGYNTQWSNLSNEISSWLQNHNGTSWKVLKYHMERDTDTGENEFYSVDAAINGTEAAEIARLHGYHMAKLIKEKCPNIQYVHLFAHSAGSWAARSCLQYLLADHSTVVCQMTLLDAFIPSAIVGIDSNLGVPEMNDIVSFSGVGRISRLDSYFSDDPIRCPGTQETFNWGSLERDLDDVCTSGLGTSQWEGHAGPIQYYADSVGAAGVWGYDGGWVKSMAYEDLVGSGLPGVTWMDSLTTYPEPVAKGASIQLNANNVRHPSGNTITEIAFYRDINANQTLDVGTDELLGYGVNYSGNWILQKTIDWDYGTYQLFARAKDNLGNYGQPATCLMHVTLAPAIPGNKISVVGYDWTDDSGSGDEDGIIEVGEDIDLGVKLRSTVALDYIMGTLSSSDSDLTISYNEKQYPPVSAGGEVWPYSTWDMILNATGTRSVPFSLYVEYCYNDQYYYQTFPFSKTFSEKRNAAFAVLPFTIDDSTAINPDNNSDGIIQSGETVKIRPKLRNTGQAGATDIDAWLTYAGTAFSLNGPSNAESYKEDYPDLAAGSEAYPEGTDSFRIDDVRKDITGTESLDFHLTYAQGSGEVVFPGAVEVTIEPAAWMRLSEETYDFGVASPGSSIIHTVLVQNVGSTSLQVTNITTSSGGVSWPGFSLPCTISAGQSKSLVVQINTTGLQGQIVRQIRAYSTGRVHGEHSLFTMSGLVSDAVPVNQIPGVTGGNNPDISGSWIVWADSSSGNRDIYAFNTDTEQKIQITTDTNIQGGAYIGCNMSSNLVVWEDRRVSPTSDYYDIYAYDLTRPDLGNFPVASSLSPGRSQLLGADSNLIAFVHIYEYLYDSSTSPEEAFNLYVLKYIGNGQFITYYTTGYTPGSGTEDRSSVRTEGDFNEGLLVFARETWHKVTNWESQNQHYEVLDFLAGDTSPRVLAGNFYRVSAAAHRFVHQAESGNGDDAIWMWRTSGANQQLFTILDHGLGADSLAIGGPDGQDIVAYDDDSRPGLFYIDRAAGDAESLIKATGDCDDLRADRYGLVWVNWSASDAIEYCFLKQPDVQVTSPGITFSNDNPIEGSNINVSVLVRNLSAYNQSGTITVSLYDGDPDAGGTSLASDQSFVGLSAHTDRTITFSSITSLAEGQHTIFAKLTVSASDPGNNNKASRSLTVQDSDILPPTISGQSATEHKGDGDGDGIIGSDERLYISWNLTDASGIRSTALKVDGTNVSLQAHHYEAVLGPLAVGTHNVTITATDDDISPESVQSSFTFSVVLCEKISVVYGRTVINSGETTPIELDIFPRNMPADPSVFIVRNNGVQNLRLNQLNITAPFSKHEPVITNIVPSGFTTFDIIPNTVNTGVFIGIVTITNSDASRSPFTFTVRCEVRDWAPTNIRISAASVPENQPSGATVGSFITIDPNPGDTFTYSLVNGTGSDNNGAFTISGNTLKTAALFNCEVKNSYTIRVRTTDQTGLWFEKVLTIQVSNENETPMDISLSNSSVAEKQPVGTTVGTLSTTDPDSDDTFTYSLVNGTGSDNNGAFTISGNTLKTAASFDIDVTNSYSIRIRSTDQGALWTEKVFTIKVLQNQTITFVNPGDQVATNTVRLSATASSSLPVSFVKGRGPGVITGLTNLTFTGAGVVSIVAVQAGDANWAAAPNVTNTFNVIKATATVTLNNLSQTYEGTARIVTATTMPAGLSVAITYNGSLAAPINAGSYTVTGVVNDATYQGTNTGTLIVSKAAATVTLNNLNQTYNGAARIVTATTVPAGLTVDITYDGHAWAPTNVGRYAVMGTVNDANYQGTNTGTLTVNASPVAPPAAPIDLAASKGVYTNNVRLTWTAVTNATSYEVWRGTNPDQLAVAGAEVIGSLYDDASVIPGIIYYYAVKAKNSAGTSDFSAIVSGYARGGIVVAADFDGDGRADPAVFTADGNWHIWMSSGSYAYAGPYLFTANGNVTPAPADFDGDGRAGPAVYIANGDWHIWLSAANYSPAGPFAFGAAGYRPAPGDFDGDGKADPAVYFGGSWTVWMSSANYAMLGPIPFDGVGYTPVPGDFDGDGKADPAVYLDGYWAIWMSSQGYAFAGPYQFGVAGACEPVPADFDGDGRADPAVYTAEGTWYIWMSSGGYAPQGPVTFIIP